ncbi:hypothetical protein CALCODRAFT_528708 [Calocera cornea HHB12733]|uniref:Uncharacterized protein n=1 Tax=Calocera cornea HHB12733 TaxID=1353952 RepID=A0A165DUR1_9BASI|nr:hypothetical protein CALCODRAFT_528708 [Calocera cornea HHB12733]
MSAATTYNLFPLHCQDCAPLCFRFHLHPSNPSSTVTIDSLCVCYHPFSSHWNPVPLDPIHFGTSANQCPFFFNRIPEWQPRLLCENWLPSGLACGLPYSLHHAYTYSALQTIAPSQLTLFPTSVHSQAPLPSSLPDPPSHIPTSTAEPSPTSFAFQQSLPDPAIPAQAASASSTPWHLRAPRSAPHVLPVANPARLLGTVEASDTRIGGGFLRRLEAQDGLSVNQDRLLHSRQSQTDALTSATARDVSRRLAHSLVRPSPTARSYTILVLPAPISGDSYFPVDPRRQQYRGVVGDVFHRLIETLKRNNLVFLIDLTAHSTPEEFAIQIHSRLRTHGLQFPSRPSSIPVLSTTTGDSDHCFDWVRPSHPRDLTKGPGPYKTLVIDASQPLARQLAKQYSTWKDTRVPDRERLVAFLAPRYASMLGPVPGQAPGLHRCFASYVLQGVAHQHPSIRHNPHRCNGDRCIAAPTHPYHQPLLPLNLPSVTLQGPPSHQQQSQNDHLSFAPGLPLVSTATDLVSSAFQSAIPLPTSETPFSTSNLVSLPVQTSSMSQGPSADLSSPPFVTESSRLPPPVPPQEPVQVFPAQLSERVSLTQPSRSHSPNPQVPSRRSEGPLAEPPSLPIHSPSISPSSAPTSPSTRPVEVIDLTSDHHNDVSSVPPITAPPPLRVTWEQFTPTIERSNLARWTPRRTDIYPFRTWQRRACLVLPRYSFRDGSLATHLDLLENLPFRMQAPPGSAENADNAISSLGHLIWNQLLRLVQEDSQHPNTTSLSTRTELQAFIARLNPDHFRVEV